MGCGIESKKNGSVKKEKEMISAYKELATYDGDQWQEFLEKICLIEIFKDVITAYASQPTMVKCIIRFIVWTYSKDSDKVSVGADWLETKKKIYEAAELPLTAEMEKAVLYYRDDAVLSSIKKWIAWQDNDTYTEIKMLKDLRVEMQISANSDIKNAQAETNYDQKFKNAKYSIELYQMIKDAEATLMQADPRLKEALQEVRKATKNKTTIGPESFV
jgi:hypothetical protein